MPLLTIIYNETAGSNTAASGTNNPATAVTNVSTGQTISTATSTTQTFSAAVNLTGVANDGSDVIWINTPAGNRHLFRIVSFTGGVSTCTAVVTAEAATGTGGTLSWAIGGRRAGIINDTSRNDIADAGSGWRYQFQGAFGADGDYSMQTGANPAISVPAVGDLTSGPVEIVAAPGATPELTWTGDMPGLVLTGGWAKIQGIRIRNTTSTATAAASFRCTTGIIRLFMKDCDFESSGIGFDSIVENRAVIVNSRFRSTNASAYGAFTSNRCLAVFINCRFENSTGTGFRYTASFYTKTAFVSCVFRGNGGAGGLNVVSAGTIGVGVTVSNCVFHGNSGDGVQIATINSDSAHFAITNSIFTNNGGYGINSATAGVDQSNVYEDFNAFHNNSSGQAHPNMVRGASDVTLTATPFVDASAGNFLLNDVAGAGRACKDTGLGYSGP